MFSASAFNGSRSLSALFKGEEMRLGGVYRLCSLNALFLFAAVVGCVCFGLDRMVTVKFYMSELGRTCNGAAMPVTALLSVSFTNAPFSKGF